MCQFVYTIIYTLWHIIFKESIVTTALGGVTCFGWYIPNELGALNSEEMINRCFKNINSE